MVPAVVLVWEAAALAWVLAAVAWQVGAFALVVVAPDEDGYTHLFPSKTVSESDSSSPSVGQLPESSSSNIHSTRIFVPRHPIAYFSLPFCRTPSQRPRASQQS